MSEFEPKPESDGSIPDEGLKGETAALEKKGFHDLVKWDKTMEMKSRLNGNMFFEEKIDEEGSLEPFYGGRPVIHRDTPIQGGVYVGQGVREAIVVDEKYGELMKVYNELLQIRKDKVERNEAESFKVGVLKEVWLLVMKVMPYNEAMVKEISQKLEIGDDQKVKIDHYIINKGGVCRHQALLAAWLLEKAITEGRLQGKVSVDRNGVSSLGGHAWVRYTKSNGEVTILDPAQNYFGKLEDVEDAYRWFYERPEDFQK